VKTTPKTVLAVFTCIQAVVMLSCRGGGLVVSPTSNPQVAKYSVITTRDATVTVEFGPDTSYGRRTWSRPTPAGGGEVDILVAGMRSFSTYHMRADVEFADGTKFFDTDHVFVTGGPPAARVPNVAVTRPGSLQPNGGVELLDLVNGAHNQLQAAVVDLDGNLIWYYDFDSSGGRLPLPIKLLPNGDMLIVITSVFPQPGQQSIVREIDLAGRTVWEFSSDDLNKSLAEAGFSTVAEQIHHDFLLLPNGHLIIIVNFHKDFTNLTGFSGTTSVLGDALIDLDPNRKPVWVWSTFDHLDVNRHPLQFPDWTHSNALVYSPDDGDLILSMRNQNWMIKIDFKDGKGSGDILWRLGPGGDFTLPGGGPIDWFYGQHAPSFIGPSVGGVQKMVLFDNGNARVVDSSGTLCGSPGALPCYSRVPIFQVDEILKTAQILWQDKLTWFSLFAGYAQELENGNVEFNVAAATFAPGTADPGSADVIEVTQETTPQTFWQLDVDGQNSYRIFRIPSLYPGVQW
jgi:arylsulfate sulfotransferase